MISLHVNIDHVATLRQARGTPYPDPVWAASICELAGAQGITVHLREDRRHIQDRDVELLRQTVRGVLNLEMAATSAMVERALAIRPDVVTLVPERREERTTEGGLDCTGSHRGQVAMAVQALSQAGIAVSLFIAPETTQVRAAVQLGVPRIELHTGHYCEATLDSRRPDGRSKERADAELEHLAAAAEEAVSHGLHVAAGHGLDYNNVRPVAAIPGIEELNIGHALIARAVLVGLDRATRDMLDILQSVS
jgi:pyridoxine 5-phosphate synthase